MLVVEPFSEGGDRLLTDAHAKSAVHLLSTTTHASQQFTNMRQACGGTRGAGGGRCAAAGAPGNKSGQQDHGRGVLYTGPASLSILHPPRPLPRSTRVFNHTFHASTFT